MDADFFFNRRLKRFKNREGQQISVILERPDILFVLNSSYKLTGLLPMTTAIGYGAQLLMVGTNKVALSLQFRFLFWEVATIG